MSLFSGTGNTRGDAANNFANRIDLCSFNNKSSIYFDDDFYLFDATGSSCNAPLLNNPIVETSRVTADSSVQWSPAATALGQDNSATTSWSAPGANMIIVRTFTPAVNMTLNSVSCRPTTTSAPAKFKPVLYGPMPALAAHRFWRVVINGVDPSQSPTINEIQFRSAVGVPLPFSGGTLSASSVSGGQAAALACDNNTGTYWQAVGVAPAWWQYDYGGGNTFLPAEIYLRCDNYGPQDFTLYYSDDGITWRVAAQFIPAFSGHYMSPTTQTFNVTTRPTFGGAAGSPLIAEGAENVGATAGNTLTAVFPSPPALTAGIPYAIGFEVDTALNFALVDATAPGIRAANTYTAGVPATLPTSASGQSAYQIWGNCTGAAANYLSLRNNPGIDDLACISDGTVGHEDLYQFVPLSTPPASIAAVAFAARMKRSDSGTRTIDVRCSSGGTDSAGTASGFVPGTSFGWVSTNFVADPNTGLPWTGTGVNAALGGVKVAS